MKGCRPLEDHEIRRMQKSFTGKYKIRNSAFFTLGIYSGFRCQELLSLQIKDIWDGCIKSQIEVSRKFIKGKRESRQCYLHTYARKSLKKLMDYNKDRYGQLDPNCPVFESREGNHKTISYVMIYLVIKKAARDCKLYGKIGTQSMRKSFCKKFMEKSGDNLMALMRTIGHSSPMTTLRYLAFRDDHYARRVLTFDY